MKTKSMAITNKSQTFYNAGLMPVSFSEWLQKSMTLLLKVLNAFGVPTWPRT